ncbi:glycosyltransferase family 2 protein [Holdemanella biformis]|uniref:glycosyltransferase family 2 protein n=1 Tax=Holdemanella biformis TaxID=1735 RepID=UPI003AB13F44
MRQISIIIPVYNASKYVSRCIESILNQSYKNIELIIINDGSTDNSLEICNKYKNSFSKIQIVSIENNGVSNARNIGIELCTSEYFMFIDADDWIEKNLLYDMSCYIHESDLIVAGFEILYPDMVYSYNIEKTETLSLNEFLDNFDYYYRSTIINSPCSKIYKKSILKDLRFNVNIRLGEDFDFNLKYLDMCKSVSVISGSSYIYDCTIAGTATKIYRTGSFEEILQVNLKGKEFCKRHNVREYNKSLDEYLCLNGIHLLDVLANSTNTFDYKHKESSVLLENQVFRNACKSIENKYGPKTIISKYLCLFNNYLLLFLFFRIKKLLKKMKVASKRIWKIKEGSLQ